MAEDEKLYGTWKIVECVSLAGTVDSTGIEGTLFTLDETGDVTWKVSEDAEPMPFFSCETYEHSVVGNKGGLKFGGTFDGLKIEFMVEVSEDLMLLTYERCCMLQCQKLSSNDSREELPFSLLGALEEGYFSDLTIIASSGKQFHVHKTVLSLAVPELNWVGKPTPLSGLHEDVLATVLHYLYGECLPRGLSEETAKRCIQSVDKLTGFSKFSNLCQTFLKSTALKNQITSLVEEMHTCADRIIDLFSGRVSASGDPVKTLTSEEPLVSNPAKLCYVFKQALREAAVAGSKLLILCDLFARRKNSLSREERHNIIKYAKARIPLFMLQLIRLFEVCKSHMNSLTVGQRHELAAYLIPEIESMMDTQCTLTVELQTALQHVINLSSGDKAEKAEKHSKKGPVADVLVRSLRNALHLRELMKLKNFHEKMTETYQNFLQKKQHFSEMTQEEKMRSVVKNMELLLDEVPSLVGKVEDLVSAFDKQLSWREFKYLFKLGTSKIAWVVNKLQSHLATVAPLIHKACDMVHREQFNQSLATIGLLRPTTAPPAGQGGAEAGAVQPGTASGKSSQQPQTQYAQLSAVESLCQPPYPRDSELATKALNLFQSQQHTDMVFEIITVQESGDVVIDHTHGDPVARVDRQKEVDVFEVRAHCVIVASQCDWARRALLSGMKESIDKKIPVHDTSAAIFKLFVEFLYCGQLTMSELSTEQVSDLLVLADRYEIDSLKARCECSLRHNINDDSALFLLSFADQYNTTELRKCVLSYIAEHPAVIESDVFTDLPDHLQAQVENLLSWPSLDPRMQALHMHRTPGTPSTPSSSSEVDLLQMNTSSSSSTDDLQYMQDSDRLETCIGELRDIVGPDTPYDELKRVATAADCDSNRALNYIYSGMSHNVTSSSTGKCN